MQVRELLIPSIPVEINLADLQPNNKLFSDDEIAFIKSNIPSDGRFRNLVVAGKSVRLRYAVIAQQGKLFAVYHGKRHMLGKGGFGIVKLVQDLETGELLPLKVRKIKQTDYGPLAEQIDKIEHELAMLFMLDEAITTVEDHKPVAFSRFSTHKKCDQHYMIMKYAKGVDLFDAANSIRGTDGEKYREFNLGQMLKIVIGMIRAVQALHAKKVLHRDIKLENFRVHFPSLEVKLIDWGFSVKADEKLCFQSKRPCGSREYIADEVFDDCEYSEKSEVYSLGCVIGVLMCLAHPAYNLFNGTIKEIRLTSVAEINASDYKHLSRDLMSINKIYYHLKKMMSRTASDRPAIAESLTFFNNVLADIYVDYKTVRVGLLDLREYQASRGDGGFDKNKRAMLLGVDQISFVDKSEQVDLQMVARLRCELEKQGMDIADKIYVGASKEQLVKTLTDNAATGEDGLHYTFSSIQLPEPRVTKQVAHNSRMFSFQCWGQAAAGTGPHQTTAAKASVNK